MIDDTQFEDTQFNAKIKVIGVGGGGSNAVNLMIYDKKDLVEYWVFNTESQALSHSPCAKKFILGKNVTKGLGAGGDPKMGAKAAEDSYYEYSESAILILFLFVIIFLLDLLFLFLGLKVLVVIIFGSRILVKLPLIVCLFISIKLCPMFFKGSSELIILNII